MNFVKFFTFTLVQLNASLNTFFDRNVKWELYPREMLRKINIRI
jgi:hypothetical protein